MEFEIEGTNLQAEEDFLLHVKKMLMNKDFQKLHNLLDGTLPHKVQLRFDPHIA